MKEVYNIGSGQKYNVMGYQVDHLDLLNDPLGLDPKKGLRILPARINSAGGQVKKNINKYKYKIGKPETYIKYSPANSAQAYEKMGYNYTKNPNQILNDEYNFAKKTFNKFQAAGWRWNPQNNTWYIKPGFEKGANAAKGNIIRRPAQIVEAVRAGNTNALGIVEKSVPKATKLPPSYGVGSTFAGVADDFLKTKTGKAIGKGIGKGARFLASDWVWPEMAIAGLEYKNRKQKGQSHERALSETLKLASLGLYDQGGTEKSIIKQAKTLGYEENDIQALDNFMKIHKLDEEIQKKIRLIDAMELGAVEQGDYGTAAEMERIQVGEEGGAQSLRAEVAEMKKMKESLIGFYYGALERAGDKEGNYGAEVYNKALKSLSDTEFNLSLEDRMKQADPYGGGIGSWLNTNVFTLDPKGQGELQQRIDAMNPEELREFNIQRGVMPIGPTYDAYDPRKMESLHDTMGYMYAGGGIAGIRRPWAIPPESGPMPQGGGLSSQFNRVKKLTEIIYGRYRKRTPEYSNSDYTSWRRRGSRPMLILRRFH